MRRGVERLGRQVMFRVDDATYKQLLVAARDAGTTPSDLVRRVLTTWLDSSVRSLPTGDD
jgi:hypothetical protein